MAKYFKVAEMLKSETADKNKIQNIPSVEVQLVGGSPTSAHVIGYAADLQPIGDTFENFKAEVLRWLDTGVKFDQCIIERSKNTQWVHFGLYNRKGQQRGQQFSLKA